MNLDSFKSLRGTKKTARHISLFVLTLLIAFTACQDTITDSSLSQDEELSIDFKSFIPTRSLDEQPFDAGDSIGIYSVQWIDNDTPGELQSSGNRQDNILYWAADDNDNWESNERIIYPFGGQNIDLYAYYPYMQDPMNSDATIKLSVAADQSGVEDYKRSDFKAAVAKKLNRNSGTFHFDFYHRLSQVQFELIAGDDILIEDLLDARIELKNIVTDGSYSFTGGEPDQVNLGSIITNVLPCGTFSIEDNKLVGKMCIIMPQTLTGESILEVTVGETVVTANFSDRVTFGSGESTVVSITLNGAGIDFTTEVKPWNEQPPVEDKEVIAYFDVDCSKQVYFHFDFEIIKEIEVDWGDGGENTIIKPEQSDSYQSIGHYFDLSLGNVFHVKLCGSHDALIRFKLPDNNAIVTGDINFSDCRRLIEWESSKSNSYPTSQFLDFTNCVALENLYYFPTDQRYPIGPVVVNIAESSSLKKLYIRGYPQNVIVTDLKYNPLLEEITIFSRYSFEFDLCEHIYLKKIKIYTEDLANIDLSNNQNLRLLTITGSRTLRVLDLSQNILLEELYLEELYSLEKPDLNNNINIKKLGLTSMLYNEFDLSSLVNLTNFSGRYSSFAFLDFSSNPEIRFIDCKAYSPIFNNENFIQMVMGLPTRVGKTEGLIMIGKKRAEQIFDILEEICSPKNWRIGVDPQGNY